MHLTSDLNDPDAFAVLLVSFPTASIAAAIKKVCKLSVSTRTVEGWRSGRNLPRVEVLPGIASATDLPIGEVRLAYSRAALTRKRQRKALAKEATTRHRKHLRRAS